MKASNVSGPISDYFDNRRINLLLVERKIRHGRGHRPVPERVTRPNQIMPKGRIK